MPLVIADRVRETTLTSGTGTLTLAGPYSGFQAFSVIGNGNTTYYAIIDAQNGAWEVGIGAYTSSGNTLSRATVLASSNAGSLVNFGTGTKDVILTQPARRSVLVQEGGSGLITGVAAFTANGVPYADSTSTLATSANMTFNGTRLTVADLADSGLTSGRVTYASTGGALVDSANLTFDGTTLTANALTVTNATTLNAGTANGVAYLNGSKVLTTGSALTFDGTNLGVGIGGAGTAPIDVSSNGSAIGLMLRGRSADSIGTLQFQSNDGATVRAQIQSRGDELRFLSAGNVPQTYFVNGSEQMRLTSTGLGIKTSTIIQPLTIGGSGNMYASGGATWYTGGDLFIRAGSGGNLRLGANDANDLMILNTSGNLGLGVTPSAWASGWRALQLVNGSSFVNNGATNYTGIFQNAFYDGSNNRYLASTFALKYELVNGTHAWFISGAGTAGNAISFTQAMTLDASGNLLVGTTSSSGSYSRTLALANGGSVGISFDDQSIPRRFAIGTRFGNLVFDDNTAGQERMRLDSSGNLTVNNTTAAQGGKLSVTNGASSTSLGIYTVGTGNTTGYAIRSGDDSAIRFQVFSNGNVQNTNNSYGAISDVRLKENITDATPKLEKLQQVRVVNYNMKGDQQKQLGVIAQELEQVFPGMVQESPDVDDDGNLLETSTLSVKYSVFVPMLIKAMQEQQALIQTLTARVAALESN